MLKTIIISSIFFFLFYSPVNTFAQEPSFGFGCLGFVGGYGGYNYQTYSPVGLNEFVDNFNSSRTGVLNEKLNEFGKASGYRVGINFVRANFPGWFISAKGFYQSTNEEQTASEELSQGRTNYEYDLKVRNWGIGLDVGIPVTTGLRWKIVDAALLFNIVKFTSTENTPTGTTVFKYDSEGTNIGYSVGSGFIIDIIEDYISLEGLAAYTFISVDKLKNDEQGYLVNKGVTESEVINIIDGGGFNAVIQLNVGFPL